MIEYAVTDDAMQDSYFPSRDDFLRLRDCANRPDVSPLRYPGGKRKLAVLIAQIFASSHSRVRLLIEPFAGGASVSIALLEAGFVDKIALADRDLMIATFWRTVFSEKAECLARKIERAQISLEERDRIIASSPSSDVGIAFKCLYINRTSFSGIINKGAGAIGGRAQSGKYTVGCRFNQQRIADRIRSLSAFRNRVCFVKHQGYDQTISDVRSLISEGSHESNTFWYFDPPFFEKAERLYRHVFTPDEHLAFKDALEVVPGQFVLSYDDVTAARVLYGNDPRSMAIPMVYSAAENNRPTQEIIVSNLLQSAKAMISVNSRTYSINSDRSKRKNAQ